MADPPDSHKRHGISETTLTLARVSNTNLFLNHSVAGTGGEGLGLGVVGGVDGGGGDGEK